MPTARPAAREGDKDETHRACADGGDGGGRLSVGAQTAWPAQPVKWIVPYPPGGSTDMLRLVSHKLGERLKQTVIVENKAAGGNLGTDYAVAAGRRLHHRDGQYRPHLDQPLRCIPTCRKPQRDLAPVTMLMSVPNLLVVNPALPVKSVKELIDWRAGAPLGYATPGTGRCTLAGELFASTAGAVTHAAARRG